jgi:hypothetical protein
VDFLSASIMVPVLPACPAVSCGVDQFLYAFSVFRSWLDDQRFTGWPDARIPANNKGRYGCCGNVGPIYM